MKVESWFSSHLGVRTEFLEESMLKRVTYSMSNTFIPTADKTSRIQQSLFIILRGYGNSNKSGLKIVSTTKSKFSLQTDKPIVAKAAKTVVTLSTRNHKPLTGNIPRTQSKGGDLCIRSLTRGVFLVKITTVTNPYGVRTSH